MSRVDPGMQKHDAGHRSLLIGVALLIAIGAVQRVALAEGKPVRVDIPVTLENAKVVFNMSHPAFQGDHPVGLKYMSSMATRLRDAGVKGQIVAVFHGDVGYMTLSDRAYNASRNVSTGNPYKQMLAELVADGVQIEECAATMRNHGWTNDDLLPNVKVNAGAIGRIVQLVQQGYVQIEP